MKVKDRIISFLLTVVMVVGLLPLGHVVFAAGDLANVSLSPEGVLTWDDFSGAGCYSLSVGHFECTTEETTFNVKDLLDSGKNGSGTYSVRLYAMDKEPSDGGVRISSIWQKPYSYTSPWPQLSTPTNLKWTDNVGSWESVPNATKYKGRLWVDSFGNTSDPINFETTSNSIDFSDYFVSNTHQYAFVVYATNENYIDSAYATSEWVTRTKDLPSLQNVSISSEGVLTWNAFTGATLYSWSYQCGSKSGGGLVEGTSVNIKQLLDEGNAPSGEYTIGLYALDKHPGSGGVQLSSKWWGEYDYVFSYVFTTQPQGGTITNGGQHAVTWATNFTPVSIHRFKDGATDTIFTDPTSTSDNISKAGVYKYRVWYGTGAAEYVESDEFTISIKYNVTINSGSADVTTAAAGTTVTLTAGTAPAGKEFDKWVVNSGAITLADATSATTTFTMPAEDVKVTATYKDIVVTTYNITVNSGSADATTAAQGATVTLTADAAPAGKEFDKWVVDSGAITLADATSATTTFTMPAEDVEVTATYKDIAVTTYNITVNSGTADVTTPASGATVTITAGTAPAGKEFDKWVVESGTITLADATSATTTFTMPAENVEVTATYKDIVVTAISIATPGKTAYTVGDSLDVSGMEIKVDYSDGSSKTIPVTAAMVIGFDSSVATASQTLTITYEGKTTTYNVSISAVTPTTFTVTFNTNGGSAVASQTVADGSKAVKPDTDPTKEGYTFDGWYQDATFTAAFDFNTAITADTTIYAKWTESTAPGTIYYTVVSGANGTWTEGDIVVTVKRSEDDEHCIDYFTGVKIDDKDLVNGTDYTAVAGSTVVTIKGSTLESLSKGGHTITVTFKDGTAVTSITLKDKASGTNTSGSSAIPSTGETTSKYIGVAVLCFVASGALFGVVLLERKKRKCAQ